jgi:hypothetical protein
MKKAFRKYRLVCACLNFLGGFLRLVAALVGVAANYLIFHDRKMDAQVRA